MLLSFISMNGLTIITLIIMFVMLIIQYLREHNFINIISLLLLPYVVIILFNQFVFSHLGFFRIKDEVLLLILMSTIIFFLGAQIAIPKHVPIIDEKDNVHRFGYYNIPVMINTLVVIGIIGLIKLSYFILNGSFITAFDEMEGVMGLGPVGHLLLFSYSLLPIVYLYWLEHKKSIKCLFAILSILIVTFSSFIKYNIVGVIVSLFVFTAIYKKSFLKKSIIGLVVFTLVVFTANYWTGFSLKGVSVPTSFYLNHFWSYVGGSMIYDNYIFSGKVVNNQTVLYKAGIFVTALPSMFWHKFTGENGFFLHKQKGALSIHSDGLVSNLVDAFGYLYPYNHDLTDYILYYIFIFIVAVISTKIYFKFKNSTAFDVFVCNFTTYFIFFSFFGTFYINAAPWEILVYSICIPNLFLRGSNIFAGKIRKTRFINWRQKSNEKNSI